jgi:simple sugar transport system permease protein
VNPLDVVAATVRFLTPILLAALGGVICERAGVVCLALEGFMLAGAFTAAAVAAITGDPWLGVAAGAAAGVAVASVHAAASVWLRADQIVVGMALNVLAMGATAFLGAALFDTAGSTPRLDGEHSLGMTTVFGVSGRAWLSALALALAPGMAWWLKRTPSGLRLRAVGDLPLAAEPAGFSVSAYRVAAALTSGLLAGMGGAYLSTAANTAFNRNMTAGRGYVALAAVILGRWHPLGALLGCLAFAVTEAIEIRISRAVVPDQLLQVLPYVVTVVVLVIWRGRSNQPKALGKPYEPGR